MRWLVLSLAIVTVGAASQPRITTEFLLDLFRTCSEDRWVMVPGYDVEVTCYAREVKRI